MKKRRLYINLLIILVVMSLFTGCRQARRVSSNLSKEADNFNILRRVSVINQRTDTLLFTVTGNFSVQKSDGDLDIVGENPDGTYYKHFIYLADEIVYIVEDLGETKVDKHKYEINFNPEMIQPFKVTTSD